MAYNNPASWNDLDINNESFLDMLSKQMIGADNTQLLLDPTRFPAMPLADNLTPPASEHSSPSPPNLRDRHAFPGAGAGDGQYDDDPHKRKVDDISDSDDDDEDSDRRPQHKAQHRADGASGQKRTSARKKGGAHPDENRALKRKEQNRAAQRAFRERKERHVKELEDQVSVLQDKNSLQDRENDNLRDLLKRLQKENQHLKEKAFTFSFPPGASKPAGNSPTNGAPSPAGQQQPSSPSNVAASPPSSNSTVSSPESLPDPSGYTGLFAGPPGTTSSGDSPASDTQSQSQPQQRFQTDASAFNLNTIPDYSSIDFSKLVPIDAPRTNRKQGYTTIASNPLFTSYQDPMLDPLAWSTYGPGDYAPLNDASNLDLNLYNGSNGMLSFDEIFGQGAYIPTDISATGGALGAGYPSPPSTSLISMVSTPSSSVASPIMPLHEDEGTCPKTIEEARKISASSPPSTFGPPIITPPPALSAHNSSASVTSARPEREEKNACAHARMAALCADLPRTVKKPNQIEIGRAWEKVRQHPQFEECDIDELCNELSAKARCDGSRPVLEEASFHEIVQNLPGMFKRK